jgi:3-methyladenine DNA glycosylase/8-oxoguanine DNA glycosylase
MKVQTPSVIFYAFPTPEVIAASSPEFLKERGRVGYRGEPITPKEVEKCFETWGEFKGLAFWFWDWKYKG